MEQINSIDKNIDLEKLCAGICRQNRKDSMKESVSNSFVGIFINLLLNFVVIVPFTLYAAERGASDFEIACYITFLIFIVATIRNYFVRRFFNK